VSAPQAGLISKVEVAWVSNCQGQVLAQIQSPDLLGLQREVLNADTTLNLAQAKLNRDQTLLTKHHFQNRWQETKAILTAP